jgi:hypothetical protein
VQPFLPILFAVTSTVLAAQQQGASITAGEEKLKMKKFNWRILVLLATLALFFISTRTETFAQFGRIKEEAGKLGKKAPVSSLLEGEPPITTSLSDALYGDGSRDTYNPNELTPLTSLERTLNGGFALRPGLYEMHTQSYCLKAGTHGPGGGDGYLYAPPKGPAREAVVSIVRNSVRHPAIDQHKIQLLLWAIIARAKFENLSPELKAVASQLLTPEQLAMLNRRGLDMLPGPLHQKAMEQVPPAVRQILEAEARIRQMLTTPGSSFDQIESVAVLAGMAPLGEGSHQVPWGRWSRHPDGYYVRYLPRGYAYTVVQIWVPEGSPAMGKEYDPALHIAVPGNTARQRLIQSGRVHQ